jgi:hypothetical protein
MARISTIITVTQGGLLYRDIADIVRWIDFKQCNRQWFRQREYRPSPYRKAFDARCVARRSFGTASLPYIEFFTIPVTRLEFDDPEDLWTLLKEMQRRGGWMAYDND